MFEFILFDLDGTLTDPREGITKSVQYALDKMGIHEPDLTALEHFIGPPLYDEFMRCYGFDDAQAKQAVVFYRERFSEVGWQENILFDGVPGLLQALRDAGKKIAIASSKPTVFVERILHLFEIERFFDVVSGATLDGSIGTKSQVVAQALELLHVADRGTLFLWAIGCMMWKAPEKTGSLHWRDVRFRRRAGAAGCRCVRILCARWTNCGVAAPIKGDGCAVFFVLGSWGLWVRCRAG